MTAGLLLIASPFLTWVTIVSLVIYQGFAVFGTAAQSNLLMVSSQQAGASISQTSAAVASFSIFALLLGGLALLRWVRLGVILAASGIVSFAVGFYTFFGSSTVGLQSTYVSPGIGVFTAAAGVVLGIVSTRSSSHSVSHLARSVRSWEGITAAGVTLGTLGLGLDVANHTALGQLSDFVGTSLSEQVLHLGLFLGICSMLTTVLLRNRVDLASSLTMPAALATLSLLATDALRSFTGGTLNEFLGHNSTESVLHLTVYYGVAMVVLGCLVRWASTRPPQAAKSILPAA